VSDPAELLTLHALRLRSLCEVDVVAVRFDLDPAVVAQILDGAADAGLVRYRAGRMSGWSLTGDGRRHAEALLVDELAAAGTRPAVEATYGRFLPLNARVLEVCTDWQVVQLGGQQVVNAHDDADRDAQVLERFSALHFEAMPIVDELSGSLDRLGGYTDRLAHAHDRVVAGDHAWLTRPTVDSYHTVWFELHEDLLATLGRSRSDERGGGAERPAGDNAEEFA
jgi:hypothetical protein